MGTDINAYGIKHKLEVRKPARIARQISDIFKADVEVRYWDEHHSSQEDQKVCIVEYKRDSEKSPDTVIMYLPFNEYLCKIRDWSTVSLDDPELATSVAKSLTEKAGECYEVRPSESNCTTYIYEDLINLETLGYRWWVFEDWFKNHAADGNYIGTIEEFKQRVNEERNHDIGLASAFGCDFVIYTADQGEGEWIEDQPNYLNAEQFVEYIKSKKVLKQVWKESSFRHKKGYTRRDYLDDMLIIDVQKLPVFPDKETEQRSEILAIFDYFQQYPDLP